MAVPDRRNEVVDASRRRQTAARHAPSLRTIDATEAGPEGDVLRTETMAQLRALVDRLPDTQRDAILLRYAGGLPTREIALTLGRSEAATQKLITRALAALKEATVRPIDKGGAATAAFDPFDALVSAAFAAEPGPEQIARMDARLEHALDLGPSRVGRRPLRRTAWVLAAAATIIVIGGAGAIALQRFEGWSGPDFDVAWERGAVLGLTDVVDGYEVTLERAYADAGQVMLAVAIEDIERRPDTTQLSGFSGTLVDDTGAVYVGMGGGGGTVDPHEAAELWYYDPPAFPLAPGPRHFTLTLDEIEKRGDFVPGETLEPGPDGLIEVPDPFESIPGPWVIEFDLVVAGGVVVDVNEPATGPHDVTVTVGIDAAIPDPGPPRTGGRGGRRSAGGRPST